MKVINLTTNEGITTLLYPDNQPHLKITEPNEGEEVKIICSITNSIELLHLLQCSDALTTLFCKKKELHIPYLMAARFDRAMQKGDSFDLRVIANLINLCGFEKVFLYDVHSEVATALIDNSINISNAALVEKYNKSNSVLICPDAGAAKKIDTYLKINSNLSEVVYCTKVRDLSNGKLKLNVLEAENCYERDCVIIDDLCDGGGTFIAIADQIKPKSLTLVITHGIFSNGFSELEKRFNEIIVSDSYRSAYPSRIVNLVNLNP